jgi:hypothetical protein
MPCSSSSSSEKPDVVVVVGGVEFFEYRQVLRCISDYFDAAFRSGMKEAQNSKFEFVGKNPEEWELLMQVMAPASPTRITQPQLDIILQWADELCIPRLPVQCDDLFAERILSEDFEYRIVEEDSKTTTTTSSPPPKRMKLRKSQYYAKLIASWEVAVKFQLERCNRGVFAILSEAIHSEPYFLDLHSIQQMIAILKCDEQCRTTIWPFLEPHLHYELLEQKSPEELLDNELLPYLLYSSMQICLRLR